MSAPDEQSPAPEPVSAAPATTPADPGVSPPDGGGQAAPAPDTPLFAPPKMEAITAGAGPQDVKTLDKP
jgi:hypothetical protein